MTASGMNISNSFKDDWATKAVCEMFAGQCGAGPGLSQRNIDN